jgi:hypothetical protein
MGTSALTELQPDHTNKTDPPLSKCLEAMATQRPMKTPLQNYTGHQNHTQENTHRNPTNGEPRVTRTLNLMWAQNSYKKDVCSSLI